MTNTQNKNDKSIKSLSTPDKVEEFHIRMSHRQMKLISLALWQYSLTCPADQIEEVNFLAGQMNPNFINSVSGLHNNVLNGWIA